jgi:hypothetical protein
MPEVPEFKTFNVLGPPTIFSPGETVGGQFDGFCSRVTGVRRVQCDLGGSG